MHAELLTLLQLSFLGCGVACSLDVGLSPSPVGTEAVARVALYYLPLWGLTLLPLPSSALQGDAGSVAQPCTSLVLLGWG